MTWRIEVTVGSKDNVETAARAKIAEQFRAARALQQQHFPAHAQRLGKKPEEIAAEMAAFWAKEDEQVGRALKAALFLHAGHPGAKLQVRLEGHCNADGTGVVTASVVTLTARG